MNTARSYNSTEGNREKFGMRVLAQKAVRRIRTEWRQSAEKRRLSPMYSPATSDLDIDAHIREALAWLKRAQDAGTDRGVSYGVSFGHDFEASYPETTGYICQTFVEQEQLTVDADLLRRAVDMGEWEIAIQLPEGAVMGGRVDANPTPAVFNTGMVLLGWSALIRRTGQPGSNQPHAALATGCFPFRSRRATGFEEIRDSRLADPPCTT